VLAEGDLLFGMQVCVQVTYEYTRRETTRYLGTKQLLMRRRPLGLVNYPTGVVSLPFFEVEFGLSASSHCSLRARGGRGALGTSAGESYGHRHPPGYWGGRAARRVCAAQGDVLKKKPTGVNGGFLDTFFGAFRSSPFMKRSQCALLDNKGKHLASVASILQQFCGNLPI